VSYGAGNSLLVFVRSGYMRTQTGETKCPKKEISYVAKTTFWGLTANPACLKRSNTRRTFSSYMNILILNHTYPVTLPNELIKCPRVLRLNMISLKLIGF